MKKLFLTLIFISTVFTADDLLLIYNEALERDPEFNSKKADLKISKEFRNQSISALLPRLNLSASTNWNEYYQERILQNDYNTFTYNLNFNQPLFRLDSWFTSRQAQKNYRAAEAQFAYQQQNLMIRVTRAILMCCQPGHFLKLEVLTKEPWKISLKKLRINLKLVLLQELS